MKLLTVPTYVLPLLILSSCQIAESPQAISLTENATKEKLKPLESNDYMSSYSIIDEEHGTKTTMKIIGDMRVMTTNALPNHETGTFPNKDNPNTIKPQNRTYSFPLNPINSGKAKWAREPGVALNGIKFEPETAEQLICETGQHFRIEAKGGLLNFGLDENNAHVQPTGAYHYHGVPTYLIQLLDKGEDLIHVGFAKDGFPIYYSKSGAYKPSYVTQSEPREGIDCNYKNPHQSLHYDLEGTTPDGVFVSDWIYQEGAGDLDECNGITINGNYLYLLTDTYPYVGRCLMGEFKEDHPQGPPPGNHHHGQPNGHPSNGHNH